MGSLCLGRMDGRLWPQPIFELCNSMLLLVISSVICDEAIQIITKGPHCCSMSQKVQSDNPTLLAVLPNVAPASTMVVRRGRPGARSTRRG